MWFKQLSITMRSVPSGNYVKYFTPISLTQGRCTFQYCDFHITRRNIYGWQDPLHHSLFSQVPPKCCIHTRWFSVDMLEALRAAAALSLGLWSICSRTLAVYRNHLGSYVDVGFHHKRLWSVMFGVGFRIYVNWSSRHIRCRGWNVEKKALPMILMEHSI